MKFNHAFDVAFSIENESPTGEITVEEALAGLQARLEYLRNNPGEVLEALGAPFDTYEVET